MNQFQQILLTYILDRVKEDKIEEAKLLLSDNFQKQAEGKLTKYDITLTIPKIIALLKPDKIEEVQGVIKQFSHLLIS